MNSNPNPYETSNTESELVEKPHYAELDMSSIAPQHKPNSEWRQNGTSLRCISCQNEHGIFLPPGTFYTGKTDEKGMPIVEQRF